MRRAANYVGHYVSVAACYVVIEQLEKVLLLNVESQFLVLIDSKKCFGSPKLGKPLVIEDDCRHIAGQESP